MKSTVDLRFFGELGPERITFKQRKAVMAREDVETARDMRTRDDADLAAIHDVANAAERFVECWRGESSYPAAGAFSNLFTAVDRMVNGGPPLGPDELGAEAIEEFDKP